MPENTSRPAALAMVRAWCPTASVGILTANLASLGAELRLLEEAGVRLVHVDVMDGCFCPMMTVGPPVIKAMKTPLLKDAHLMIQDPLEKVADFVAAGADMVTVHAEAGGRVRETLARLRGMVNVNDPGRGILRGVALKPGTPLETLAPLVDELELIWILAVEPGIRGQEFHAGTWGRLEKTKEIIRASGRDILLAVDGGITRKNVDQVAAAGPDIIVTGSAVFDGKAPRENARFMLETIRAHARA